MTKTLLSNEFIQTGLIVPEGKRSIEYCDLGTARGMYVAVLASSPGRGTYYLRWKNAQGKTAHTRIGRTDEISLAEARTRALALKTDIHRGKDPQAEMREKKRIPTFGEFFRDSYLPLIKAKNRTWENAEEMFRLRIEARFGDCPLSQISVQQLRQFHVELKSLGLSGSTSDHHVKLMRHIYSTAISFEVVEKNPASKVPLFNEDNKRSRYVRDDELPRLLGVLKTDANRSVCNLVLWLLATGMRLSEALTLEFSDIDQKAGVLTVRALNSKSKRVRHVPLNDVAKEILAGIRKRPGQTRLFIGRKGEPLVYVHKVWHRLREKAGIADVRLHDLRHTYASYMVSSGQSLYSVQQALGHADASTTIRYAHLSNKALQDAADTVAMKIAAADTSSAEVIPLKPRAA
jgi:integrase